MRTTVKGKNLDVLDRDRRYAEQKMQRLSRLLDDRSEVIVEYSIEHNRSADETHIAELTLLLDGQPVRGRTRRHVPVGDGHGGRQTRGILAVEHKERPRTRSRSEQAKSILRSLAEEDSPGPPDRDGRTIVKVKRFAIEPMFEEDAVARMEELGHTFFLFVNAENEHLALLYRRRDGDFGMIEPTIGGAYTPGRK